MLHRQRAAIRPAEFGPGQGRATEQLRSLLSLISELDVLGRSRAAYQAGREAIAQIRNMAGGRIDEELRIDLAMRLTFQSIELGKLGWMEEALEASKDAVTVLAPGVADDPATLNGEVFLVVKNYLEACERIDQPVDQNLLDLLEPGPNFQ